MTPKQFSVLIPGQHVRLTRGTRIGVVKKISEDTSSALVRWRGGDISWEKYYMLDKV